MPLPFVAIDERNIPWAYGNGTVIFSRKHQCRSGANFLNC